MVLTAEWEHDAGAFELNHPDAPQPQLPPLLDEFWRFQRYGLPPNAGGLRDQPLRWFEHGETLAAVYRAWRAWLASDKGPEWRKGNPALYDIVRQVRKAGLWQMQS